MDPHKPVLSRSALSCERKGDRVSIIAHEEIPTGMEGMISLSFFLPLWPSVLHSGKIPNEADGHWLLPLWGTRSSHWEVWKGEWVPRWEGCVSPACREMREAEVAPRAHLTARARV